MSELKDEIKNNLHLTLFNSTETVTMANASEHDVTFTVTYYDENNAVVTNDDAHVTKFSITAKLADGKTLDATSMELSNYHTVADISNAGIEEPWLFVNTAASGDKTTDADYTYKKPKEAKLEKLVYNENNFDAAGSKISELDYQKNNGKIYYELTIPTSLTCKDLLTIKDLEITDTLPAGVTFDISNVITVGALPLNDDGSVPHQGWLAQTIYGSDGRAKYEISTTKNFSASKLILAQPTLTVRSRLRSTRATTFPINRRFSISATGSALRRTPLGTIFVRKTSTATAQNGTAIRQKRKPPSSAATKSFIRPALLSMKAPMPPAISLLPRRSTTALLSTPPAISC